LIALRTQQLLAHESGVANTIDPLAGSYFVESLTNRLEEKAYAYFEKIKNLGGIVNAIETGFLQREIAEAAFKYQKSIENRDRVVVGVNEYVLDGQRVDIPLLKIDSLVEESQKERLDELRKKRDARNVEQTLSHLMDVCRGNDNIMIPILEATRAYATLGEICGVLKDVFGEYREPPIYW
jgi:methylmalonyl-CoA mutase N-terminal domain/subunit